MTHEPRHAGVQHWVKDLNHLYRSQPVLYERDFSPDGFQWIDHSDADNSTLFFLRRGRQRDDLLLAAFNFTPVPRHNYRVGVPRGGYWKELLNSDAQDYGGSGQGNSGGAEAGPVKQDITERLRAEERLRETEQFFRSVLELAPDGLIDRKSVV